MVIGPMESRVDTAGDNQNAHVIISKYQSLVTFDISAGADPGFLEGGVKFITRGFVFNLLPDFS